VTVNTENYFMRSMILCCSIARQANRYIFRPAGMYHSGCSGRMMQQRLPVRPYRLRDGFGDVAADCYAGGGNSRAAVYGSVPARSETVLTG
jgi:hypothetical protein